MMWNQIDDVGSYHGEMFLPHSTLNSKLEFLNNTAKYLAFMESFIHHMCKNYNFPFEPYFINAK